MQDGIKLHFWAFGMTRPGIQSLYHGLLANTVSTEPIGNRTNNTINSSKLILFGRKSVQIRKYTFYFSKNFQRFLRYFF